MVRGHGSRHPTTPAGSGTFSLRKVQGAAGGLGERAAEQLRGHLIRDKGAPAGAGAR